VGGQRRKKGSRVTPKGSAPMGRLTTDERAGLEEIFERVLRTAPKDLTDDLPPVVVEMWASQMWSIWAKSVLVGMDATEVFAGGMIAYAGRRSTPGALMVLRALAGVAPPPYGPRAREAADRLAAQGVAERQWAPAVGRWEPTVAWLSHDPIDDDGVNVMVEFGGTEDGCTVGVYIDHNLGGMAKDAFVAPVGMDETLGALQESHEGDDQPPSYREIPLEEAAARWRAALAMTDMYLDPPSTEDLSHLRALIDARLAMLPPGGEAPVPGGIAEDERESLLSEFLDADETVGLWGVEGGEEDEVVEQLAQEILAFSLDAVGGEPLRFSPVMVEIFCLDWAPRKIAMDGDAFTLLPDVLAAWIRFVGGRRGLSDSSISDVVRAAYEHAPEMIELCQDPEVWGPAKTMALAIAQRGIDLADQKALDDFVAEVNHQGGIDVLADSLVESVTPKR